VAERASYVATVLEEEELPMRFWPRPAPRLAAAVAATALLSAAGAAQTMGTAQRYTATAINTNPRAASAGTIDITVNRWSTDKQRDTLVSTLLQKGPDTLLDVLQDMPSAGHFGAPGSLSWDLRFARRIPLAEGGERVVLVTDRPIGLWEARHQPRSIDYPFTVIELRLNAEGEGEGKMSLATKVIHDKDNNMITLENYDLQQVMLTNVRRERAKASD
jgi:hypothetical protein